MLSILVSIVTKTPKKHRNALFALLLLLGANANATSDEHRLQSCLDMQGKEPSEITLECYGQIKQEQQARGQLKALVAVRNHGLVDEWTPPDAPFSVHKQNYLLFNSFSSQPNNSPSSTSASSQVTTSYPLDRRDVKFQISLKAHLLGVKRHAVWLGYTQLSFWQFYDTKHSMPFRETNYQPELIYSYLPENLKIGPWVSTSFLNAGLVHQSNGQSLPRSRSWSRYYIQAGFERNFGENGRLALLSRIWKRFDGGTPDITNYLGQGDIELRYCYGQGVYSVIAMQHSYQIDFAIPITKLFGVQLLNTNLHLQYFEGYGESLIDYNQSHHSYGFGISVPIE